MIFLNFTHPLTPAQRADLDERTGGRIERVLDVRTQFDPERSFVEQASGLLGSIELSPEEWQTVPLLVNLPGHSAIAGLLLAEIHGRAGHFPAILRLAPVTDVAGTVFRLAEIVNLQAVRDGARERR